MRGLPNHATARSAATCGRMAVALATIPESIRAEQTTIEISGLRKQFGRVTALDDLDLLVPHAAVGLLGANGAGKTTLLRVLLG